MNKSSIEDRARVINCLIEGNSVNSTVRLTGIAKTTILRLIAEFGEFCNSFHDERVVDLKTKFVQCDEIWAFCHCKKMNTPKHLEGVFGVGDVWTWTAIDADSKLMIEWYIGLRDAQCGHALMHNLRSRLANRVQISTDGLHVYHGAIANCFDVDTHSSWAKCIKTYEDDGEGRYSPGRCTGVEIKPMWGNPDLDHASTSFVERGNLTMRMGIRRYTRLTKGHSKNLKNHEYMTTIFFTHYNWCRPHMSLAKKTTPAMASGLT